MRRRNIDIEDEVRIRECILQFLVEERLNPRANGIAHGEEKIVVVLVALTQTKKDPIAHETPELERWVEVDVFSEDEVVGDFGLCWCRIRRSVRYTSIKRVLEVMCNEIATLQQEVHIVCRATLHVVGCCYPGCVFGCAPVQLGCYLAELGDCLFDPGVQVFPFG